MHFIISLADNISFSLMFPLQVLRICFPHDLRVNEVRRMLQSAQPVRVKVVQRPEVRSATTALYHTYELHNFEDLKGNTRVAREKLVGPTDFVPE